MRSADYLILLIVSGPLSMLPTATFAVDKTESLEQAARDASNRAKEGYERLSRRRTFDLDGVPYGATALPIAFFTPSSGLHYGGWLEVANYGREPYVYRANVQWYLTTKGKRNHHMRLEFPAPFGFPVNARLLTRDLKSRGANFFGIGNDTEIDKKRTERESDYYRYLLEQQQSAFDLEYAELEPMIIFSGLRFNRGVPSRIDEEKADAYYVFDLRDGEIRGRGGGWANFIVVGLMFDSRDDQEAPSSGLLSEASLQLGSSLLGADYGYRRVTLINTHYWRPSFLAPTSPNVLVTRVVFESLGDDAPFYELTEVGGSIRGVEVGGGSFMRGFKTRRFADRMKMLYSAELRRTFKSVHWRGHYFETLGMLFGDAGRVAPGLKKALDPSDLHGSGGFGCRVTWNSQLSIRADFAASAEGNVVLLSFGNLF
ncbi:MAG: BamA/TamA family outer membrane protein [Gemmatimonadetes bacterium]|nr:BamA/TamA family outer membrane protein [Gemmatimonadota bacterium]MBT6147448.1 BamA/TamA family outer membrane protein [Gemmatimonadota bacterium]MBT7859591.1 BamA/TamA family outer membrane protein [Gemmatimonadota bacterium]